MPIGRLSFQMEDIDHQIRMHRALSGCSDLQHLEELVKKRDNLNVSLRRARGACAHRNTGA